MDFWITLMVIMLIILLGLISFLVLENVRYPYFVVIRELGANRKIIHYDKGAETESNGVKYLQLRRRRDLIALPPSEAIEITRKGKKHIEMYYNPQEQSYTYLYDTNKPEASFDALTTNQRISLVNQTVKAFARKQKTLSEILAQYAAMGALVIIVVSLFIFYGDIAKPVLDMGGQVSGFMQEATKIADKQAETTAMLQEIIQKKQIIPENEGES